MSENTLEEPVSLKRHSESSGGISHVESYPSVPLSCEEVLKLPEYGLITFRYKRGAISVRSATRNEKASASTTLELCDLCSFEEAEPEEDVKEDYKSPIDRLFDQAQEDEPEKE